MAGPHTEPVRELRETALRGLPRSAAGSLWRTQTEAAARAPAALRGAPAPTLLLTKQVLFWAWNYLRVVLTPRERFRTYRADASVRPGVYTLPDSCVIALAADWGTGTKSAYAVGKAMRDERPDVTIHLGDVYYSGTEIEFREYFLGSGRWPVGTLQGTDRGARGAYALNGNHEMYSGGSGYFRLALPALGQEASYFCLENAHWRIVGLDTGYYAKSFPFLELIVDFIRLHRATRRWLKGVVFADPTDRRPVILLSHHQWFSAFDTEYPRIGRQLRPYLDRVLLWFWGHEHRFAGYAPFGFDGTQVRARCIGHGGMPIQLGPAVKRPDRPLVFTDERTARELDGEPIGYCGFALLRLTGPELRVEYYDEAHTKVLEERWQSSPSGVTGSVTLGTALKCHRALSALVDGAPHPLDVGRTIMVQHDEAPDVKKVEMLADRLRVVYGKAYNALKLVDRSKYKSEDLGRLDSALDPPAAIPFEKLVAVLKAILSSQPDDEIQLEAFYPVRAEGGKSAGQLIRDELQKIGLSSRDLYAFTRQRGRTELSAHDNRELAEQVAHRLVAAVRQGRRDAFKGLEFRSEELEIYLPDVQLAAEAFSLQCSLLAGTKIGFPCVEPKDERHQTLIPVWLGLEGIDEVRDASAFPVLLDMLVSSLGQSLIWKESGRIRQVEVPEAINLFEQRLTNFLTTRFAARRSNISAQPGLQFAVTTHSAGLRVYYSPIYLLERKRVLNYPTTPAKGYVQPGTYYFGAGLPGVASQFDFTASYDVPPDSHAHLAM